MEGNHSTEKKHAAPIVMNIGKTKGKLIKAIKRGEGELLEKVTEALRQSGRLDPGKEIIPVVLLYRKKDRRARGGASMFGPF